MTDDSKENEKKTAIQVAILAGFHLDPNEALSLLKTGFFNTDKDNSQSETSGNKPASKMK